MKPEAVHRPALTPSEITIQTPMNFSIFEIGLEKEKDFEWDTINMANKTKILKIVDRMIKGYEKTSLIVIIGDTAFDCHLIVLQAFSTYFQSLSDLTQTELNDEKVTPTAFEFIYDWLLSDNPRLQREQFFDIFTAARFLDINEMVEQGWACLASLSNFNEEKALAMYMESKAKGDEMVMQLMLNRISKMFLLIVASKEFLEFTCKEVVSFLELNQLAVHSETEILFSAIRWLFHDWANRKQYLMKVIDTVRFVLIHPSLLVTLSSETNSAEVNEVMKNPQVDKLVKSCLEFMLSQYVHREGMPTFELSERFNIDDVDDRLWIEDPEFNKFGKSVHFWPVDYKAFLKYLGTIRMCGVDYWKKIEYVSVPSFLHTEKLFEEVTKEVLSEIDVANPLE